MEFAENGDDSSVIAYKTQIKSEITLAKSQKPAKSLAGTIGARKTAKKMSSNQKVPKLKGK